MYKEEKAKDLLMKALKVREVLSWNPAGKLMENKDVSHSSLYLQHSLIHSRHSFC